MAKRPRTRSERPSHPPLWLVEGLDIVQRKRFLLAAVVVAVVVLGALFALLFPDVMPRTPEVGAAIGLAALLLGLAAAVATDATDLVVRGPRHVAAAGGELVAVLPREPSVAAAGPLAAAVLEVREPGVPLLLALATAGRDARRSNSWTDAIARALVAEGVGVLRVDLASGRSEQAGLVEVVRDGLRLADAVTFEPGLKLAHLSAGHDHGEALLALTELPGRLPRDLDIMLVSLPTVASRSVVSAATALDHVLVVVERDRTSRVDLIASLDALEAAGTHAQAILLDTQTALRLAPPVESAPQAPGVGRRAIASTVGTAPVVVPGSEPEAGELPTDVADEQRPAPGAEGELPTFGDDTPEQPADSDTDHGDEEPGHERAPGEASDEELSEGASEPHHGDEGAEDGPAAPTEALAAGVAGAGVAAGLGAVVAGRGTEDDLDVDAVTALERDHDDADVDVDVDADAAPERDHDDEADADAAPAADEQEAEGQALEGDEQALEGDEQALDGSGTVADAVDGGEAEDAAGEQRDLELLEAAAAATALSAAGAGDEPHDDQYDELPAAHDLEEELPQPDTSPLIEEVVELPAADPLESEAEIDESVATPAPTADHDAPPAAAIGDVEQSDEPEDSEPSGPALDETVADDAVEEEDDPTDRLPPVTSADADEDDLFAAGDEDLLRTTAQLAMLADDLELRSQGRLDAGRADSEQRPAADDDEHDGRA